MDLVLGAAAGEPDKGELCSSIKETDLPVTREAAILDWLQMTRCPGSLKTVHGLVLICTR